MRRIFFVIFIFVGAALSAQKTFTAGIIAGLNGCQIHGDSYSGYDQVGFVAGAFVQNNPGETWQVQMAIQYSRKGSRHVVPRYQGGYRDFEIRLNYTEVPLLIRYNTKRVYFDAGVSFGYMFKARTWDVNGETVPQDFKKFELAMVAGIGYNLNDNFSVELVTSNTLLPIKEFVIYYPRFIPNLFNRGMYNNLLGVMFNYRFGGGNANE